MMDRSIAAKLDMIAARGMIAVEGGAPLLADVSHRTHVPTSVLVGVHAEVISKPAASRPGSVFGVARH